VRDRLPPGENGGGAVARPSRLSADCSVSIVVTTYDRRDDLRDCLRCLVAQQSPRRVEIVVVDNTGSSTLTARMVAAFPGVRLVREARQGEAYARNAGILASTGEIVVTTDDDVTMPEDWLEHLLAPFADPRVMAVTGNVRPRELATAAQRLFEVYGGLGRAQTARRVDGAWFRSFRGRPVPTWELGATANAAFRADLFSDPRVGLFDEEFGAGSPTAGSDDTGYFYKLLKAGYTLAVEPAAWVWHKHRRGFPQLRAQLYNYSKAHVAYHLLTLFRDGDLRALTELVIHLPRWRLREVSERLRGRSAFPCSLVVVEILGNLAGPWALWQAHRRVQRHGRSGSYRSGSARTTELQAIPPAALAAPRPPGARVGSAGPRGPGRSDAQ
jgi:GT2 family glycosyltransferase